MVIGNTPKIAASLFAPGYSIAAVIANEFTEATGDLYLQSLIATGTRPLPADVHPERTGPPADRRHHAKGQRGGADDKRQLRWRKFVSTSCWR